MSNNKMKLDLVKVKFNRGQMDNGQKYDYTKVFFLVDIYEDSETEFGMDLMECEFGDFEKHRELLHFKGNLPCEVEFNLSQVMKKGKILNVASNITAVGPSKFLNLANPSMIGQIKDKQENKQN